MKQGEKKRETAAPARQSQPEPEKQNRGENRQEPAQPASQSVEERRRQAGLRRVREEEMRRQAEEKRVSQAYAAGLAAQASPDKEDIALTDALAQDLPEEEIHHPSAEMVAGLLAQRRQELLLREGERQLQQELDIIGTIDPTLGKVEESLAGQEGAALLALMEQTPGLRLSQAYILMHFDRLSDAVAKRAARMAAGKMAGTHHLHPMPGRGNGGPTPPQATLEMYRALFPGKADSVFTRHWKKRNED